MAVIKREGHFPAARHEFADVVVSHLQIREQVTTGDIRDRHGLEGIRHPVPVQVPSMFVLGDKSHRLPKDAFKASGIAKTSRVKLTG